MNIYISDFQMKAIFHSDFLFDFEKIIGTPFWYMFYYQRKITYTQLYGLA